MITKLNLPFNHVVIATNGRKVMVSRENSRDYKRRYVAYAEHDANGNCYHGNYDLTFEEAAKYING